MVFQLKKIFTLRGWLVFFCLLATLSASAKTQNAQIILKAFEPESLKNIIKAQQGQPFVLVVWSLDCEYCQTSLRNLADKKRKTKKLRIVTVSTDMFADEQSLSLMQDRLQQLNLAENAWAFGAAPAEQLRFAIDPLWHGEMPRSYWFDAKGRARAVSGVLLPKQIDQFMQNENFTHTGIQ
jgi:hypothetical protein